MESTSIKNTMLNSMTHFELQGVIGKRIETVDAGSLLSGILEDFRIDRYGLQTVTVREIVDGVEKRVVWLGQSRSARVSPNQ